MATRERVIAYVDGFNLYSRVRNDPAKERWQATYIDALRALPGGEFRIFYGKYHSETKTCRGCGASYQTYSEKMTDVNIAVEMMADAFQDRLDTALLVSADSDLTAPVTTTLRLFPKKRVVVAFPPERSSKDSDGFVLTPPTSWR